MEGFFKSIRWAGRGLVRNPGLSVVAVVALALGIGLTTVMFSIVYGALHRGLPFEDADRIMHLERSNLSQGIASTEVPIHDFVDWRERQRSFEDLAAFYQGTVNIRGTERPERYEGGFMSAGSFDLLGVEPLFGRTFTEADTRPGAPLVLLLGHRVWQNRFGGERSVLGRTLTVNGEAATVVGVMPEGFEFPVLEEVWVPLRLDPVALPRGTGTTLEVFGKLREDVDLERATAELTAIADRLGAEHPETNEGVRPIIKPYTEEFIGQEERSLLYAMMATVLLVLVIACANVANLLLARAAVRTREVAVHTALGASRLRVIVQMLAEALVLAAVGAVLGVGIAWLGITLFDRAVQSTDPPFWLAFQLDAPVLAFVVAVTAGAALVSGMVPALRATSMEVSSVLKDESRGSSGLRIGRLSRWLVVAEVAMSVGLLVAAGLLLRSVVNLNSMDYGFPTEDVFTARVGVFEERFPDAAARLRFWRSLDDRLDALAGVRSASLAGSLPGTGSGGTQVQLEGESYEADRDLPSVRWTVVSPDFFETLDVDVLRGRGFTALDGADAPPVAVVNESFGRRHFPQGTALGRRFKQGGLGSDGPWIEIVGVVPDLHMEMIGDPNPDTPEGFYRPLAQVDRRFLSIAARTDGTPLQLTEAVRDVVTTLDADTPIYWVDTLQGRIDEGTWFYRVFGALFSAFGAAALFMASVGLYGVMSFTVSRRVQEMGIRMSLGAGSRQVLGLVLRQGLAQIAVGLILGSGLAFVISRSLQLVMFRAEPWDPATYLAVFAILGATGLAATAVPAFRATRIDPMEALRYE